MPRDGSNIYHRPPGTDAITNTTIASTPYNSYVADVEQDLNLPRPIVAGGTGASSATQALFNLSGETAAQNVTNWDTQVWLPGSFYAATSAAGTAPVAAHAFAGICYNNEPLANPPTGQNLVLEARDLTDTANPVYVRIKTAGVWSAWARDNPATYVRYDAAQALTPAQRSQARANVDVTKKNYIINGAMMVSQENGATAGATNPYFPVDMFSVQFAGTTGTISAAQVAGVTPSGSSNRFRLTVSTADAAVAAADIVWLETRVEGFRAADLRYGSAAAKTTTLQFGCKGPAGTYSAAVLNGVTSRSYTAEYTLAANVDTIVALVIPGDVAGTWTADNSSGLVIRWGLMTGTTYQQAAGAWGNVNSVGSPNQFNFMGTGGNTFDLFDVGLYEGNVAPPFQVPDYASELALCQRYFNRRDARQLMYVTAGSTGEDFPLEWNMRATPTAVINGYRTSTNVNTGSSVIQAISGIGGNTSFLALAQGPMDANFTYSLYARL